MTRTSRPAARSSHGQVRQHRGAPRRPLLASVIITTQLWFRLTQHELGPAAVPTVRIVLGWLGQSITAVNLLGGVAPLALPEPYATAFVAFGLV